MLERVTDAKIFRWWGRGILLRKEDSSLEEAVTNKNTHPTSRPRRLRMRESTWLCSLPHPWHLQWGLTHGRILINTCWADEWLTGNVHLGKRSHWRPVWDANSDALWKADRMGERPRAGRSAERPLNRPGGKGGVTCEGAVGTVTGATVAWPQWGSGQVTTGIVGPLSQEIQGRWVRRG